MNVKVRFAPSPTGRIHIGNTRTLLLNWLFAKKNNGEFLLRFDDTDQERSEQKYCDYIIEDLRWLEIKPSAIAYQSTRFPHYDKIVEQLKASGRLYPCYETPDELDRKRKRQLARGMPPVYDRKALELSNEEKQALEKEGRKPHWRFMLENKIIEWNDLIRGRQTIDTASLSDPVLIRADGSYLYTLPSVIDDIDYKITHVIRGEDHVANTATQIQLFEFLEAKSPQWAHHNLLTSSDGKGFSKRLGSLSIANLRGNGLEAMAVISHAALIGTSDSIAPYNDINKLVELFDFSKMSRSPARFDENELKSINSKLLHSIDFSDVKKRLEQFEIKVTEEFWLAVRGNLEILADTKKWWHIINDDDSINDTNTEEDRTFLLDTIELLPEEPWDSNSWGTWIKAIKEKTGRKGKQLFMPIRKALTGLEHGPELNLLLPLIGKERVIGRLRHK